MFDSIRRSWSRDAVGFRQGELDDGDGMAATVVAVIGGPALVVGAALVAVDALTIGQVMLVAPVAALLGCFFAGSAARMAAQTGAPGTWILRPAFGRGGSVVVSVVRLLMIGLRAVVGLGYAGGWAERAASESGLALPVEVWVGVIVLLGLLMLGLGLETTVKRLIRLPLFAGSVLLVGVLAWVVASRAGSIGGDGGGSFWAGTQRAIEAAVVFIPYIEAVARRLRHDEEAMPTFSVSYAVPATLMFAAGAVLALLFSDISDLTRLGGAGGPAAIAIAWVVIAEVDQAFAAFVAAGSESVGIVKTGDTLLVGLVSVGLIVVAAVAAPAVPADLAFLATSIVFPAMLIASLDFHLVEESYYPEADIYGRTERAVNLSGFTCWLFAVVFGQLLDPVGPPTWTDSVDLVALDADLPWRLIAAVVAGAAYVLIARWTQHRTTSVYGVRDVSVYGHRPEG